MGTQTGTDGVVILRDLTPDGSYGLLECTEFEPSGGGGVLGMDAVSYR